MALVQVTLQSCTTTDMEKPPPGLSATGLLWGMGAIPVTLTRWLLQTTCKLFSWKRLLPPGQAVKKMATPEPSADPDSWGTIVV
jgi:hypothetical protein